MIGYTFRYYIPRLRKDSHMPIQLTDDELALQAERSAIARKGMEDLCRDFGSVYEPDEIGLMISGGIDSTTLLFSFLSVGIRPHLYTFIVKQFPKNSDARRVRKLAEHFDLPLTVVEMPDDHESAAEYVKWEIDEDWRLESRPDIEVGFFFNEIAKAAHEDGIKGLFCGLDPLNIYLKLMLARERLARVGAIPDKEHNAWQMNDQVRGAETDQYLAFGSNIYNRYGINLINPQFFLSYTGALDGLPWRIMSRPRDRAIATKAFEKEYAEIKQNAVPVSMLKGDTGGRDYFEMHIPESKFAQEFMRKRGENDPSVVVEGFSATQFYNQLKKERAEREEFDEEDDGVRSDDLWDYFSSNHDGGRELPEGYEHPWEIKDGEVDDSWIDEEEDEEEVGLFSDIIDGHDEDEIEEEVEDEGDDIDMDDKRIDCWGRPIRETYLTNLCPRARAGLCGHEESPGFDMYSCGISVRRIDSLTRDAQAMIEQCFGEDEALTKVVHSWVSKCRDAMIEQSTLEEEEERLRDQIMEHPQESSRAPTNLREMFSPS